MDELLYNYSYLGLPAVVLILGVMVARFAGVIRGA